MERSPWNSSYFFPKLRLEVLGGKVLFSVPGDGRESRGAASPALLLSVTSDPAKSHSEQRNGVGKYFFKSRSPPSSGTRRFSGRAGISFCSRGQVSISLEKAHHDTGENAPQFPLHFGGSRQERGPCSGEPAPASLVFYPLITWRAPDGPNPSSAPAGDAGKASPAASPCATMCPVCLPLHPASSRRGPFPPRQHLSFVPGPAAVTGTPRDSGCRVWVAAPALEGCRGPPPPRWRGIPAHPTAGGGGSAARPCPQLGARRCAGAERRGDAACSASIPRRGSPPGAGNAERLPAGHSAAAAASRPDGRRSSPVRGCATCAAAPPRLEPRRARPRCPGRAVPEGRGGSRGGSRGSAQRPPAAGAAAAPQPPPPSVPACLCFKSTPILYVTAIYMLIENF